MRQLTLFLRSGCFVCLSLFWMSAAIAQDGMLPPEIRASFDHSSFSSAGNLFTGTGNVEIAYQDVVLIADTVTVDTTTLDVEATGNVQFRRGDFVWHGEQLAGNLRTKQFDFGQHRAELPPWYLVGAGAERRADGTISLTDAAISTCSFLQDDCAHWQMDARQVDYYPDGRFKAHGVRYSLAGIPVFYSPVVWGGGEHSHGDWEVSTGYDSDHGGSLRIAKRLPLSSAVDTTTGLTYRTRRGFALDHRLTIDGDNHFTELYAYGMNDDEPLSDRTVAGQEFSGRFESDEERYRISMFHRSDFTDRLQLRARLERYSDSDILYEFFRREYRYLSEPSSFATLSYHHEQFSASLTARPRVNDAFSAVERLPELRLDIPRQRLFDSPLYYQGESAAANLRMNWREHDLARTDATLRELDDYASNRVDTVHFLYLPFRLRTVNITPRAGARLTYYSRTSRRGVTEQEWSSNFNADEPRPSPENPFQVFNYDNDGGHRLRYAYEIGLEMSMKAYRLWPDVEHHRWGLNGLRHVVEPYLNYTYMPQPNVDKDNLFFFDPVDRLHKTHFVRVGVKHRFQTRRDQRIFTFARIENYYDFYVSPETSAKESGDFGTVVELNPTRELSVWSKLLVDTGSAEFNVINVGMTVGDTEGPHVDISYLYRNAYTNRYNYSMGSELTQILAQSFFPVDYGRNENLYVNVHYPLNSKTSLSAHYYVDLIEHRLARQQYEISRDLHCWTAALRLEQEESDFGVFLLFYLKAFPALRADIGG